MRFRILQKTASLIIILIVLTVTVYSFSIHDSFKTMDDYGSIVDNEWIRSFSHIGKIFQASFFGRKAYYRPVVSISYMVEYHLFGLNPFYYYVTNILIHTLNAIGVFLILNLILRRRYVSFFTALLFAIHPIQWEAVSNIPGRAILLCTFFLLSTFLFFLLSLKRLWLLVLSCLCFALALLCKESAGIFPVVLLAYQFFMERRGRDRFERWAPAVLPYFVLNVVYLVVRRMLGITKTFHWNSLRECLFGFITFLRSLITHFRLLIFPVDLQFDRSRQLLLSFRNVEVLLTLLFFGVLIALLWKVRTRIPAIAKFFIFWTCMEFLPVAQIVAAIGVQPGYISTAEHFLYMPSIGIFILAVMLVAKIRELNRAQGLISRRIFWFAVVGIYAFFFITTLQHNIYASNEIAMFDRTLELNPDNTRIRNSLAYVYAKLNKFAEAEAHFRKSLVIVPNDPWALIGLGKSLCDQGKYIECIHVYESVTGAGGLTHTLENNKKETYELLQEKYEEMLKKDPENAQLHYSLGVAYSKTGALDVAIIHFRKALERNPDFKDALFNLASTYANAQRWEAAIVYFNKVLNLKGEEDVLDYGSFLSLSKIYKDFGDDEKAEEYHAKAIELLEEQNIKRTK